MKSIFVGNLNSSVTEDILRSLFEAYGPVDRVNIVTDRDTRQPKGFGFVDMTNDADAAKAIAALNGKGIADYSNRGFFTMANNFDGSTYDSPSRRIEDYTIEKTTINYPGSLFFKREYLVTEYKKLITTTH